MEKRTQLIIAVAIIAIIAVSVVAYYYLTLPPERTIRIGLVASLTGPGSAEGADMQRASILAVEEINAAGGVWVEEYGKYLKVELVVGDDKTSPQDGPIAVTELIIEKNVDVLVGGVSSGVTLASQIPAIDNEVPFIITGASTPQVTRRTDKNTTYMFHYCTIIDDYSETILKFLNSTVMPTLIEENLMDPERNLRLAMLVRNDAYGIGCHDTTEAFISDWGLPIEIVEHQIFERGATDFATQLALIQAAEPDAIYHAGLTQESANLVKQGLQQIGLNTVYIAVEVCQTPQFYEILTSWGDDQILESKFGAKTEESYSAAVDTYIENYNERWGEIPGMMGADTYDAIYLACEAIKNAGTLDKAKVRDEIENIEMPQKLILMKEEIIWFDENHEIDPISFIEQMKWNSTTSELTTHIVYPDSLKHKDFELPADYENQYS